MSARPEETRPEDTTVLRRFAPGLAWLPRFMRRKLPPAVAWSLVGLLVTSAAHLYDRARSAERDLVRLKEAVGRLENQREVLNRINTRLAVVESRLTNISDEVDRQRTWRERIEDQADMPPHVRRRR